MSSYIVDPGQLRYRLELQTFTDLADGRGGFVRTWSKLADLYAAIEPASASRQLIAGAPRLVSTHNILIRYRNDISIDHRFSYDERFFVIQAFKDVDETKRYLLCHCEEVVE